jgi:hypothetical protein
MLSIVGRGGVQRDEALPSIKYGPSLICFSGHARALMLSRVKAVCSHVPPQAISWPVTVCWKPFPSLDNDFLSILGKFSVGLCYTNVNLHFRMCVCECVSTTLRAAINQSTRALRDLRFLQLCCSRSRFLRCEAAVLGWWLATFLRNAVPSASRLSPKRTAETQCQHLQDLTH